MGGGWSQVSRDVAVDMLQHIFGLTVKQSEELHDAFVSKYGRQPTRVEVKVGLGYTGNMKECKVGNKSTTYEDQNSFVITTVKSDGKTSGLRCTKQGDGWKYCSLTSEQLRHLAV